MIEITPGLIVVDVIASVSTVAILDFALAFWFFSLVIWGIIRIIKAIPFL